MGSQSGWNSVYRSGSKAEMETEIDAGCLKIEPQLLTLDLLQGAYFTPLVYFRLTITST